MHGQRAKWLCKGNVRTRQLMQRDKADVAAQTVGWSIQHGASIQPQCADPTGRCRERRGAPGARWHHQE